MIRQQLRRTAHRIKTRMFIIQVFLLPITLFLFLQFSHLRRLFQGHYYDVHVHGKDDVAWAPRHVLDEHDKRHYGNGGLNRVSEPKLNYSNQSQPLPHYLQLLQELTTSKSNNVHCPPPLKLFQNRIVLPPSSKSNTTRIPRILHLSERSRCLNRDMHDALAMWQKNFPSFSIFFHDDEAVDRLLLSQETAYSDWKSNFPNLVNILPCLSPGAMKIDVWRVLILWKFGGFYFDADMAPDTLTEDDLHFDSSWFSLSDGYNRPTQGLFAASAGHLACRNALHVIAERVLEQRNIQKIRLVYVTGPEALDAGWRNAVAKRRESGSEPQRPFTNHTMGELYTFKDGLWGQKVPFNNCSSCLDSYWNEMVPFEENKCVSRKSRSMHHFGRVHWTTAKSAGLNGLPPISCKKHLENLPLKMEQGPEILANEKIVSSINETSSEHIADLILKNSNNMTMCDRLVKEAELKISQLRSKMCRSCFWVSQNTRESHVIRE